MIYHNDTTEYKVDYIDIRCARYDTNEHFLPVGEPENFSGDIQGYFIISSRPIGGGEENWTHVGNYDYGSDVNDFLIAENTSAKVFDHSAVVGLEQTYMNYRTLNPDASVKDFEEYLDAVIEKMREEKSAKGIDNEDNV